MLIPLMIFGLAERFEWRGETWAVKDEFHVTAAHAAALAERAGVSVERAWDVLSTAIEGREAGAVQAREELRLVRDGDERTLIVMTSVEGLDELYAELSDRLGAALAPPPAHITLYTRPDGEGIALHDDAALHSLTEVLDPQDAAQVRAASRFDAVFA